MERKRRNLFPRSDDDSYDTDIKVKPWSRSGRDVRGQDSIDQDALKVEKIDLKKAANAKRHHTSEYDDEDAKRIVFRRGQPFDIDILFSKPYDTLTDDIRLIFEFAPGRQYSKKAHIELILSDKDVEKKWGAKILKVHVQGKTITVRIFTPSTLYVGLWKLSLDVIKKIDRQNVVNRYSHPEHIYMLFNPWCRDDQVYMPEEKLLEEYLLNDTGNIYGIGFIPIPWNFAQFEPPILECAIYILDTMANLRLSQRSDPIMVVRQLSALANSNDDAGILVGAWKEEDYKKGGKYPWKYPWQWIGSQEIIEQYYLTKNPVRYGQCYVFSGIVTTLCRTLGIPVRSVTNYESGHDEEGSITIDRYIGFDGKERKDDREGLWNFHVWNEVWMARPDLPEGYGGWQVIDGTPQEGSTEWHNYGVACCGPMSVLAIRRGKVTLPYDGEFIFAEVNADEVYWYENENGVFTPGMIIKDSIGLNISTDKPKCNRIRFESEREDITYNYKFKEGSDLERSSVIAANSSGTLSEINMYNVEEENDVEFKFKVSDNFSYGKPFDLTVKITNNSYELRTIAGLVTSHTTYYTGVKLGNVKEEQFKNITLGPQESTKLSVHILFEDYYELLKYQCGFHHHCMFKVEETKQIYRDKINIALRKPRLILSAPDVVKVGQKFTLKMAFKNPLPTQLTDCVLAVEGPGIQKPREISQNNVKANNEFEAELEMTPIKLGVRKIIARFNSKQLVSVDGSCEIEVELK